MFPSQGVLNDETISNIPIAVLINKIDLATCVGEAEIIYKFDLFDKVTGRVSEILFVLNMTKDFYRLNLKQKKWTSM